MAITYLPNTAFTPASWEKAGSKYPLSDLPKDKYWNNTYYNDEGSANTCVGFARMVLDATYGRDTALSLTTFSDSASVKSAFTSIEKGARVTFGWQASVATGQHAIIVAGKSSTGITAYDCNYLNDNMIRYRSWTWQDILDKFSGVIGGYHPA